MVIELQMQSLYSLVWGNEMEQTCPYVALGIEAGYHVARKARPDRVTP